MQRTLSETGRHAPRRTARYLVILVLLTATACLDGVLSEPEDPAAETPAAGPADRIYVDGSLREWDRLEPAHTDATGDVEPGAIDLHRLWTGQDGRYVFLRIDLGSTVDLHENNRLTLHLDTDAEPGTGAPVRGLGAELSWTFGERSGTFRNDEDSRAVRHADLGLLSAPTVASTTFEIALDREASFSGTPLFPGDTIRLALESGAGEDWLPDATTGVRLVLEQGRARTSPPEHADLTVSPGVAGGRGIRVLSYNVLRDGLFDPGRADAFRRILSVLSPDVVGLQEIYGHTPEETRSRFGELTETDPSGWYAAGAGRDLVVLSRFPIDRTFAIPGYDEYESGGFLLDTRDRWGRPTLLVLAHPPCCSGGSPPADERRQEVVDEIAAFVADARSEGGRIDLPERSPIVVAGDMNFVGDARQPHTLRTGTIVRSDRSGYPSAPDWDGTPLLDVAPRTTGLPANFTWYSPDSDYPPGRLDYIFVTDSVLEVEREFALFTPALPGRLRGRLGLRADDVPTASDHLPVVADLVLR